MKFKQYNPNDSNYQYLMNLLPNEEIHFIDDCEVFFNDNPELYENPGNIEDYEFIIFEYTIGDYNNILNTFKDNNIKYEIMTDDIGLSIIVF
tara:strand:+ start:345 stop:620 length:276 start_codon:yes stop_codon:yes gene_type:complete